MGKKMPYRHDPAWGAWLGREIQRAGMNQREFAGATGFGTSTISRWVKGRVPPAQYLDTVADVLVLDRDDVLARAGYRDPAIEATDEIRGRLISKIKRVQLNEERIRYLTILLDDMGRYPLQGKSPQPQEAGVHRERRGAS